MSAGFTKLFSDILESTVWDLDAETRIVWVTMLAMADAQGRVLAAVPGLAHRARVPREAVERALESFLGPDPDSRTPDMEGRRIVKIDGGWALVNYQKYREKRHEEDRREYMRDLMRKRRSSVLAEKLTGANMLASVSNVSRRKPPLAQAEAEAEAEYLDKTSKQDSNSVQKTHVVGSSDPVPDVAGTPPDDPVARIFDAYRKSWGKTEQYALSEKRRAWIRFALKSYTEEQCLAAVDAFRRDDFKGRAQHNDIEYLFGGTKAEQQRRIDRWCQKGAQRPKAPEFVVFDINEALKTRGEKNG